MLLFFFIIIMLRDFIIIMIILVTAGFQKSFLFKFRVLQAASVWVSTEIDYTISSVNLDVEILANVDVYLKVPSIKNVSLYKILKQNVFN